MRPNPQRVANLHLAHLERKAATSHIFFVRVKGKRIEFQVGASMGKSNYAHNAELLGYPMSKGIDKVMEKVLNPPHDDYTVVNPKLAGIAAHGNTLYAVLYGDFVFLDAHALKNTRKAFASLGWKEVPKRIGDWD